MAEDTRLFRQLQLQLISATARKFNTIARPTPRTPTILKSLPVHKPLLPLLLSHGIPPKLAEACADKYDGQANRLRSEAETRLAPYLVEHSDSQPAGIYTLFLNEYSQTLWNWAQIVLNSALKNLKRNSRALGNWEVTYPEILWLPPPPDPSFKRRATESICPLSPASAPPHTFPTTYPPPLRPPPGLPPVEWRRAPAILPGSPSTSIIDVDSLCLWFTKALVIDENPKQPSQPKTSIFSLPYVSKVGGNLGYPRTKLQRTKPFKSHRPQGLKSASPLGTAEPRQLSAPPSFLSPSLKAIPTSRKACASARVLTSQRTSAPSRRPDPTRRTTSTTSAPPLDTLPAGGFATSYPSPNNPLLHRQSPLDSTLGQSTHTPQDLSHSPASPTTPPTLLPELFSEPIVVPSTPVRLSPRSSLIPITDPFLQFQPQYDYSPDPFLISTFNYGGSTPGLATGSLLSKSVFDTPLGYHYPSHCIPAPITSDPFENIFNTYTVP